MSKIKLKTGLEMFYLQEGSGKDLVLISGLSANHQRWMPILDDLKQQYRVTLFDNRGTGETESSAGPYSVAMLSNDVIALMDALSIKAASVAGHSMGGFIVLQLCLAHPDRINKAVICASTAKLEYPQMMHINTMSKYMAMQIDPKLFFETVFPWLFAEPFLRDQKRVAQAMDEMLNNPHPQSIEAFKAQSAACESFDLRDKISQIQKETLIIAGREDLLTRLHCSEFMHQKIPDSKLEILENCGHMFQLEHPKKLAKLILDFLS
ncbi:MAG: alpha/beta hydrolase [Deltaproteobacteria bacterium]|nr:alpha/beta hydrolase [Deltaproteobacteria bacterium]MBI4224520.1 alpha/beta hydrolase [Deltaproteobacteria bacterium]